MTFRSILLPLDVHDPENAQRALNQARFIANASGGSVHLLHVRLQLPKTYAGFLPSGFDAEERQECLDRLEEWKARLGLPDDRVTVTLRRGPVSTETLDEARNRQADLIIIGSHLPSLSSRFLGSNASAIIRDATTSVLVVRADDRETL